MSIIRALIVFTRFTFITALAVLVGTVLIGTLALFQRPAMAQEGKWEVDPYLAGVGQDKPLCQNLLKYLNNYQGCPGVVVTTFPGFSSPPWQELDPKEHLDLIWRLFMYRGRADQYFRRGSGAELPPIPDTAATRRAATDFVAAGGAIRVWRTRLFDNYDDPHYPVPSGEQTVVELRTLFEMPPDCRGKPHILGFGSTFIVTVDLSGPDPHVPGPIADQLQAGELLLYQGTPYLIMPYGLVVRMQTSAHLSDSFPPFHYCGYRSKEGGR